jgi:hypothetical protein
MANSVYETVGDIAQAVLTDAKETTDTIRVAQMIRWLNEGQEKIIMRKKKEWLDKTYYVQTVASVDSSATVTLNSLQITAQDATITLPSYQRNLYVKVSGFQEILPVSSITGLIIQLSTPFLGTSSTSASIQMFESGVYLNSNVKDVYQVTHAYQTNPLQPLGPQEFFALQAVDPGRLDYPTHYTVYTTNSSDQPLLKLWPSPNRAITLKVDVQEDLAEMTTIASVPQIPAQHRGALLYNYGMWKLYAFHRNDAYAASYKTEFETNMAALDGEFSPTADQPTMAIQYKRPGRGRFFGRTFDRRLRD